MKKANLKRIAGIAVALLPIALLATNSDAATPQTVNVVGYSIVSKAYTASRRRSRTLRPVKASPSLTPSAPQRRRPKTWSPDSRPTSSTSR